ncbi:micro-fibrillar-associated protein 1 [Cardiosporidium cionae]|uniref:Micro-fibrillar-associated protein 1 n=1 Tax=Cardiosporidium cionae TaxID=476202 RepID=A0ABQ7J8Q5_9APIC|nr:micro-fibrillar-associated protein 1 [Cardiosporidium cionae]|eukprot:KAF8820367.1 micro-fibrillar-associated protein 1 [Cardiosporidium cionae]
MSAGDIHSILYRGEDPLQSKFRPKILEQRKVQRYWPGKVPDYAPDGEDDDDIGLKENAGVVVEGSEVQEKRLLRVQESRHYKEERDTVSENQRERQTIIHDALERNVEIEVKVEDDDEKQELQEELEEPLIGERRALLRQQILSLRQKEEEFLNQSNEVDESEEDPSSGFESNSDYEEQSYHALLKPIFVSKSKRDTIKEKHQLEIEEKNRQEALRLKNRAHKIESQRIALDMMKQEVVEESNVTAGDNSGDELPDDNDDVNEAEEYELWKVRELKRLKRDKENRSQRAQFVAEIERRRGLTEEELLQENKALDATAPKQEKKFKQLFMQKYYHKGAFFQDKGQAGEESIYLRDFHAPVGEDHMNKKILPKAMRLRRGQFGHAGQVKHTHLVDIDTTDFNIPWAANDSIRRKYEGKMAGLKQSQIMERPSAKQN